METDTKLNYFKKKILTHLEELQRIEHKELKKSLLQLEELNKSALPLEQAKDFYVDTKSGSFVLVEEYGMKKNKQCRKIQRRQLYKKQSIQSMEQGRNGWNY